MSAARGSQPSGRPYRATALETASGILRPGVTDAGPLPPAPRGADPLAALDDVLLGALQRPPCVVSFSGGQDSSAVLAAAADVARREGLPLPVPVTLRFDAVDTTAEAQWQEAVVRHLVLPEWQRVPIDHELDLVGPVAAGVLRRHGPLWPFNTHFHVPVMKHARGGSLLTGVGGDELFWRRRHRRLSLVLSRQRRPHPRDALRAARALLPVGVRAVEVRMRRGFPAPLPWLDRHARQAVERQWYREVAREPVRFDRAVRQTWWHSRTRQIFRDSFALVAEDHDVRAHHPLQAPPFLSAVMARVRGVGYPTRIEAMRDIFGDLLPDAVVERRSKATFDRAFWNRHSRAFARSWSGSGLEGLPVVPAVLRALWSDTAPRHLLTWPLFQAVWHREAPEPVDTVRLTPASERAAGRPTV